MQTPDCKPPYKASGSGSRVPRAGSKPPRAATSASRPQAARFRDHWPYSTQQEVRATQSRQASCGSESTAAAREEARLARHHGQRPQRPPVAGHCARKTSSSGSIAATSNRVLELVGVDDWWTPILKAGHARPNSPAAVREPPGVPVVAVAARQDEVLGLGLPYA